MSNFCASTGFLTRACGWRYLFGWKYKSVAYGAIHYRRQGCQVRCRPDIWFRTMTTYYEVLAKLKLSNIYRHLCNEVHSISMAEQCRSLENSRLTKLNHSRSGGGCSSTHPKATYELPITIRVEIIISTVWPLPAPTVCCWRVGSKRLCRHSLKHNLATITWYAI